MRFDQPQRRIKRRLVYVRGHDRNLGARTALINGKDVGLRISANLKIAGSNFIHQYPDAFFHEGEAVLRQKAHRVFRALQNAAMTSGNCLQSRLAWESLIPNFSQERTLAFPHRDAVRWPRPKSTRLADADRGYANRTITVAWFAFHSQTKEEMCSFFDAFMRAKQRVIFSYCASEGSAPQSRCLTRCSAARAVKRSLVDLVRCRSDPSKIIPQTEWRTDKGIREFHSLNFFR